LRNREENFTNVPIASRRQSLYRNAAFEPAPQIGEEPGAGADEGAAKCALKNQRST
jgi:hypothetical protein